MPSIVSNRVGTLPLIGTVSMWPEITTRRARPRLVRAIMASPSRMTSRWSNPASDSSMASAMVASSPETDSMSQSCLVRSIDDADRRRTGGAAETVGIPEFYGERAGTLDA